MLSIDMYIIKQTTIFVIAMLLNTCFIVGCEEMIQTEPEAKELIPTKDLGPTIGSLADLFSVDLIPVEGYGLIGGLRDTGSAECPPHIRAYLEQYILRQLPEHKINIERFISSSSTAVVRVYGMMPAAVSKKQYFDVRVVALPDTQTTSLEGGWLYSAELKEAGKFGRAIRVLAIAEGPVFIDTTDAQKTDMKTGYVLAGGMVLDEYPLSLILRKPDYSVANTIRNLLNGRFGPYIAKAISAEQIELKVPAKYREQKQRFISIVKAMYLNQTTEITKERIMTFVKELAVSQDKNASEIALEAIGNESISKLPILLNSSNEQVRLRAARCILNLGNDMGLKTLMEIAMDKNSAYRVEALEAMTTAANRNDASAMSRRLLQDAEFDIRLAAYEQLRKLDDVAVKRTFIARSFYLEQITQTEHKSIFVSRSGRPRIVLFGAPIYCRDNIFVQSADGNITINAPSGQGYVSITRKHPEQPEIIAQLRSTFELGNIIETLCEEPAKKHSQKPGGLGVSYAEAIALIKQMLDKGALEAEFRAGPLPKIDLIIK